MCPWNEELSIRRGSYRVQHTLPPPSLQQHSVVQYATFEIPRYRVKNILKIAKEANITYTFNLQGFPFEHGPVPGWDTSSTNMLHIRWVAVTVALLVGQILNICFCNFSGDTQKNSSGHAQSQLGMHVFCGGLSFYRVLCMSRNNFDPSLLKWSSSIFTVTQPSLFEQVGHRTMPHSHLLFIAQGLGLLSLDGRKQKMQKQREIAPQSTWNSKSISCTLGSKMEIWRELKLSQCCSWRWALYKLQEEFGGGPC